MVEKLNRHLSKEDIQVANRHIKSSVSFFTKEMQIKTPVSYYVITVRMIIKKVRNNIVDRMWRKGDLSKLLVKMLNWCSHYGEEFLKKLKISCHMIRVYHSWVYIQKDKKALIWKDTPQYSWSIKYNQYLIIAQKGK